MRITIDTNGHGDTTGISYNGIQQDNIKEFCLTIRAGKNVKLQVVEEVNGKNKFMSFFGEDFKKMEENLPVIVKEN
jgi:hypothetical protein